MYWLYDRKQNYICYFAQCYTMRGMSYKEFRESHAAFYDTPEGRLSRAEIIKKLESFIVQRLGDGKDFFKKNQITEIKQA